MQAQITLFYARHMQTIEGLLAPTLEPDAVTLPVPQSPRHPDSTLSASACQTHNDTQNPTTRDHHFTVCCNALSIP
jgi:hypothetical protein